MSFYWKSIGDSPDCSVFSSYEIGSLDSYVWFVGLTTLFRNISRAFWRLFETTGLSTLASVISILVYCGLNWLRYSCDSRTSLSSVLFIEDNRSLIGLNSARLRTCFGVFGALKYIEESIDDPCSKWFMWPDPIILIFTGLSTCTDTSTVDISRLF